MQAASDQRDRRYRKVKVQLTCCKKPKGWIGEHERGAVDGHCVQNTSTGGRHTDGLGFQTVIRYLAEIDKGERPNRRAPATDPKASKREAQPQFDTLPRFDVRKRGQDGSGP